MNQLPTKRLHGRTPFEAMHGRAPNLSHMRVFGSVCYPLNVIKNSKSMVTALPHIFCGYDDSSQGYVCFDPVTEKFKVRARSPAGIKKDRPRRFATSPHSHNAGSVPSLCQPALRFYTATRLQVAISQQKLLQS